VQLNILANRDVGEIARVFAGKAADDARSWPEFTMPFGMPMRIMK
jgi:hypothetical protein